MMRFSRLCWGCGVTVRKFEELQEGVDGETLHEDGKDDHAERQVQDLLAIGKRAVQAEGQSKRQGSAKSAPYGYMLPTKRDLLREAIAQRNEQIYRQHAPQKHGTDGQQYGGPILEEFTNMDLEANQKKDERIHDERNVLPKRLHGDTCASTHSSFRTEMAKHTPCRCRSNHTGQVQVVGEQITAIGKNRCQGDLDLGIIHGFRDPARQVSQPRSEDRSPRDCQDILHNTLRHAQFFRNDSFEQDSEEHDCGSIIEKALPLHEEGQPPVYSQV